MATSATVSSAECGTKRRVQVKSADMDHEMQIEAARLADEALDQTDVEMKVAQHIKQGFDNKYPAPWQCIVGRKYGSYVTHESGYFVYFFMGHMAILLFKSKD